MLKSCLFAIVDQLKRLIRGRGAHPDAVDVVKDLARGEEGGLDRQHQEVDGEAGDPVDGRDARDEEAPAPGLHPGIEDKFTSSSHKRADLMIRSGLASMSG